MHTLEESNDRSNVVENAEESVREPEEVAPVQMLDLPISEIVIPDRLRPLHDITWMIESIGVGGLQNAILVTPDGQRWRLVSGLHRLKACESLGHTTIRATVMALDDLQARLAEIDENLVRYDLAALERGEHLLRRKELYEALRPQTRHGGDRKSIKRQTLPLDSGFVKDTADKTERSERTIREYVSVAKKLAPEVKKAIAETPAADNLEELKKLARKPADAQVEIAEKLKAGEAKSVVEAAWRVERQRNKAFAEELNAKPVPMPAGPFDVIVADPPWHYDGAHTMGPDYPTMTIDQICGVPVGQRAAPNSVLWLWVTETYILNGGFIQVLNAWGFTPKQKFTWDKVDMVGGKWFRGQTESLIFAIRGKPTILEMEKRTNLLREKRPREHSRKPESFYELVNATCSGSKVELFSRTPRQGWTAWGAETEKFAARGSP
jgi:ParB family chromosome partitioning protein